MKFSDILIGECFFYNGEVWTKTILEARHSQSGPMWTSNAFLDCDDENSQKVSFAFIPDNKDVYLVDKDSGKILRDRGVNDYGGFGLGSLLTAPLWLPILSGYLLWQKARARLGRYLLNNRDGGRR